MFYIITGKVGWQGQMTWHQLSQMLTHGMQMGSHTVHHVDMGQVYLNSPEQAQQELQVSRATMQQRLGVLIQQFCYPSGEPFRHGSAYLRQVIVSLLTKDGYIGATTDPGITGIEQSSQRPFALLRLRIDGRDKLDNFVVRLP
jgi:peptidoglycan/xylan/chitin deacetylase (PgdA/CDA1 family)